MSEFWSFWLTQVPNIFVTWFNQMQRILVFNVIPLGTFCFTLLAIGVAIPIFINISKSALGKSMSYRGK